MVPRAAGVCAPRVRTKNQEAKNQRRTKLQAQNPKPSTTRVWSLGFEVWSFFGSWLLGSWNFFAGQIKSAGRHKSNPPLFGGFAQVPRPGVRVLTDAPGSRGARL